MGGVVETAGLALHDQEPGRISRLLDQTVADFSIGIGRSRVCGKCRQRGLPIILLVGREAIQDKAPRIRRL
jgi:hypothetical protein